MIRLAEATPRHARAIARAIVEAIGHDHCREMLDGKGDLAEVEDLFCEMAGRDDTQYSYRNAIVALDDTLPAVAEPVGVCVAYDGSRLHELRRPFFDALSERYGINVGAVDDECDAGEYYIDTLAVAPSMRRQGIATMLLQEARRRARLADIPAGLLVDPVNDRARRVYERAGFRFVAKRPFFGIEMDHLLAD